MTVAYHVVAEADGRPTPEVLGRLRPSAFVGALVAGGLAWFGLLRLAAWLV